MSDPPLPEIEARSVGWITPEQGQAVKEFVENGGTARFYHNVTNVALCSDDFRDSGNTAPAGWAYEYGDGRVCYLSPGYLISALWNPEYEKVQKNAVRWLLEGA